MSDFSAYFQLELDGLDGNTLINAITWGPNPPTQYRTATLQQSAGRIPIDVFTRSAQEPGGKSPPASIAREGALIVARWVAPVPTNVSEIGIWPVNGSGETQRQPLTNDLSVRLWGFPGDELWLYQPPAGPSRGRLDVFMRGINFRDLDQLLELPRSNSNAGSQTVQIVQQGADPNVKATTAFRTIYVLAPPGPLFQYNLPPPWEVVGRDLVFVNTTLQFVNLQTGSDIQGQPGVTISRLGRRKTAHLTSYGNNYTELGLLGDTAFPLVAPTVISVWRGLQIFTVGNAGPHTLPLVNDVSSDSRLLILNVLAGPCTFNPQPGQQINNLPTLSIPANTSRIITPNNTNGWSAI